MLSAHMTGTQMRTAAGRCRQRGVFLIEALIAILIFSIGILSLVAIQTAAMTAQNDAQFRVEAANFADQMMSQIWLNVARNSGTVDTASLGAFKYQTTTASTCTYSPTASDPTTHALVTAWVNSIGHAGTGLPGPISKINSLPMQQILVDTTVAAYNKVTVTVCWQSPLDASPHHHTLVSFIN
jgi:type IV pilus assembly protein PilV